MTGCEDAQVSGHILGGRTRHGHVARGLEMRGVGSLVKINFLVGE